MKGGLRGKLVFGDRTDLIFKPATLGSRPRFKRPEAQFYRA